jgi:hypothetical protein
MVLGNGPGRNEIFNGSLFQGGVDGPIHALHDIPDFIHIRLLAVHRRQDGVIMTEARLIVSISRTGKYLAASSPELLVKLRSSHSAGIGSSAMGGILMRFAKFERAHRVN